MKIKCTKLVFVCVVMGLMLMSCGQQSPVAADKSSTTSTNGGQLETICNRAAPEGDKTLLLHLLDDWEIVPQKNTVTALDGRIEIKIVNRSSNTYELYPPVTMGGLVYIRAKGIKGGHRVVGRSTIYAARQYSLSSEEEMVIDVDVTDALRRGLFMVPPEAAKRWSFEPGKYTVDIYIINPAHKIERMEMVYCPY